MPSDMEPKWPALVLDAEKLLERYISTSQDYPPYNCCLSFFDLLVNWFNASLKSNCSVDIRSLLPIAESIAGIPVMLRSGRVYAKTNRQDVLIEFPLVDVEPALCQIIETALSYKGGPLRTAILTYGKLIILHPFTDANGRIGRSLFLAIVLHRLGKACSILMVLSNFLLEKRSELISAQENLGLTNDWKLLQTIIAEAVIDRMKALN